MDLMQRMLELSRQGYYCAQILMLLILESEGKENTDLIRTMAGLNGGIGNTGDVCGCFTGGACLLSYYLGKGEPDELPQEQYDEILSRFAEWFREYTLEYGGTDCRNILQGDDRNRIQRCPLIMEAVMEKSMELLEEYNCL